MRPLAILLFALVAGCAAGPRIVATDGDRLVSVGQVADAVADADVVALGELHGTPDVHRTHHALIEELYERRPNLVIAMEMFERDTQVVLLKYLTGLVDEATFRKEARVWPHYERDYRPVIEFAKERQLHVIAANAPRPLASKAAKEGLGAVMGNADLARETSAPKDGYWDSFNEMMAGHGGMLGDDGMERYYASQCLKDDTMAESITDYLQRREGIGKPLVVFICGRAHSDHGWGTVQRIRERMPDLDVRVLSAELVDDLGSGAYQSSSDVADFVIVAPAKPEQEKPSAPAPVANPHDAGPSGGGTSGGDAGSGDEAGGNPEGMAPAFGFMPEYGAGAEGILVGRVTPGGCAEKGGLQEGDVILSVDGMPVPDIEVYMEVMETLRIGRTAKVKVLRNGIEADMDVEVGSRASRR